MDSETEKGTLISLGPHQEDTPKDCLDRSKGCLQSGGWWQRSGYKGEKTKGGELRELHSTQRCICGKEVAAAGMGRASSIWCPQSLLASQNVYLQYCDPGI